MLTILPYPAVCYPYPKRRAMHKPSFPLPPLFTPRSSAISNIRQPLDNILALRHTHDGHTRNLPDPPLQISIIRRHKIDPMLHNPLYNAIICIRALVITLQPLPSLIPSNAQRNSVLWPQLLQLSHHAGCDDGRSFCIQEVHERFVQLEFRVHGVREEVGVDKHAVGGPEGSVGLEEERGGDLGDFAFGDFDGGFLFGFEVARVLVLLSAKRVSIAVVASMVAAHIIRTVWRLFGR